LKVGELSAEAYGIVRRAGKFIGRCPVPKVLLLYDRVTRGVDRRENSIGRSVGRSGTPWTDVRSVSSGTRSTYIQYQGCPVPPPLLGT
jgi:hypothetical protein